MGSDLALVLGMIPGKAGKAAAELEVLNFLRIPNFTTLQLGR